MNVQAIQEQFQTKVAREVRLESEGVDRFRVFTPFVFEDGDHFSVLLKRTGDQWYLCDEGHTFMHLTYAIDEKSLLQGTRSKTIDNVLSMFRVEDRDGEFVLPVPEDSFGDALYSYVQALIKISDVSYLSRERVKSTFLEDFQGLLAEKVPENRRTFNWNDAERDPHNNYVVDCKINGMERPLLVYALNSDARTRDATIALLKFEKWELPFRAMAIFEDQEAANRKVLARFSDVCEKMFSSLSGNTDRIHRYLDESISL